MILDQQDTESRLDSLIGEVQCIANVSAAERNEMLTLMQRFYVNVTKREFESDFYQKDWVIVARHPADGSIQGFSTQVVYPININGDRIRVLFSGDTIVNPEYWAKNPLASLWGQLAIVLMDAPTAPPLYWFLISKGYKTYRFLPVFFREFYPRYDRPTPTWASDYISNIATQRFGAKYDSSCGIIQGSERACRLRATIADITTDRRKDAHVAFFDQINPGHAKGDELCCIAALSRQNFNKLAYRVIGTPDSDLLKIVRKSRQA